MWNFNIWIENLYNNRFLNWIVRNFLFIIIMQVNHNSLIFRFLAQIFLSFPFFIFLLSYFFVIWSFCYLQKWFLSSIWQIIFFFCLLYCLVFFSPLVFSCSRVFFSISLWIFSGVISYSIDLLTFTFYFFNSPDWFPIFTWCFNPFSVVVINNIFFILNEMNLVVNFFITITWLKYFVKIIWKDFYNSKNNFLV